MQSAALNLVGVIQTGAAVRWELVWSYLPTSWGVFVLVAVVAALIYSVVALYRREQTSCPFWVKNVLAALRSCTLLLLAAVLLNPAIVDVESRTIEPTIVVARDASASMGTADDYADPAAAVPPAAAFGITPGELRQRRASRVDLVNRLLSQNDAEFFGVLAKKGNVELVDFAEQAQVLVPRISPDAATPPLVATTGGTNLSAAIEAGLKAERPAAIVVFTDGQQTSREDVLDSARHAKQRRVPLLLVGVGDASRPKMERVRSVFAPAQAWQAEPFEIEAIVNFQGANGGSRRLQLFEQRLTEDGQIITGNLVATAEVSVPEGGDGQATTRFSRVAIEPGRYVYRAALETSAANEKESAGAISDVVTVLSRQSIRVLLMAGTPTWDYRLVQTLLSRDKTISVSCWLQSLDAGRPQDGNRPIRALPKTKAELYEYDVVLLLDPNPHGLDTSWFELLREFVSEHAGGLLFMAGPQHTAELFSAPAAANVTALLPIKFGDIAGAEIESLTAANQNAWPLKIVPANADHPLLRFSGDRDDDVRRWQSLPGVYWSLPVADAAPAAQVLVEHTNPGLAVAGRPRPLIVAGRYGSGNTLYMGFSGTWRWRSAGQHAEFFDKFWIGAARYLVEGRSLEGQRRGYVQTDRDRYEAGQRVNITARLLDAAFQPLRLPKLDAIVEQPGKPPENVPLAAVGDDSGRYEGAITALITGVNHVSARIPDASANSPELKTSFVVELPSREANQTWLNRPLLMQLAAESGGRYFEVNEINQLAAAVPNRIEKIEERSPPRPLWDTPGTLVALVLLLSTEWLLRKRFSLL